MRRVFVLVTLVGFTLAFAGCTRPDLAATTTTTTTTPPTTTNPTPSSSTPVTTTEPPPTTTTTPPPVTSTPPPPTNNSTAKPLFVNLTHDYSTSDANLSFEITNESTPTNLSLNFRVAPTPLGTFACAGKLQITVYSPNGTIYADVVGLPGSGDSNATHCGLLVQTALPKQALGLGVWHVAFVGPGNGIGEARVKPAS